MFVYEPALIMINGWAQLHVSLLACVSAVLGCICLAAGLHGYLLAAARIWERALLVCAALLLIAPELVSSLVGLTVLDLIRDEGLQENARDVGRHLRERLEELAREHPILAAVHGSGFYLGP